MTAATDRRCVLVVEDEPRNIALMRAVLAPLGHEVAPVVNLEEARTWLDARSPDLVLLDRHLPDGDGLDLARQIRAESRTRTVPILLVSASVLPADREAAEQAGCDGFFMKPISIEALRTEVARLIAPAG